LKHIFVFIVFIIGLSCVFAQEDNTIRIVGDSLVGKIVNGESIREVHGNVVMNQGKVIITCGKAIQYIARNEAELIGNVVVIQDSITINTDLGYYYGDSKVAFSKSGVKYFDGHVHLQSQNGYYYFDQKKAYFFENVRLNDSISSLNSNFLTYYDDKDSAVAVGNVIVKDTSSIIHADSLIHLREKQISFAYRNVSVIDPKNKLVIFGDLLESYQKNDYSKILGNPLLIKIDTTNSGKLDTLVISSKYMKAYSDSTRRLIATDSVKIARGDFSSINSYSIYFQSDKHLYTFKRDADLRSPVLWNGNTQLIGDTVNIFLQENRLSRMNINSNALIITDNPEYDFRYEQVSGKEIKMFFGEDGLELSEVKGNVLSIYYLYEDGEPNGLLKSSSEEAKIFFKDNDVENVRLYGNPVSEYHPENLVQGKEKDFTLPTFIIIPNKPTKEELLKNKEKLIESISHYFVDYGK